MLGFNKPNEKSNVSTTRLMSESDIENKVASKLVHMLLSKGVSKIIKKYGYLPVDYLKNEKNEKTLEMMMAEP